MFVRWLAELSYVKQRSAGPAAAATYARVEKFGVTQ